MSEADHMKLALEVADAIEQGQSGVRSAAVPGQFRGKLKDVLAWLRQQNIPWAKIIAALPQIIAALSAGDWASVIAAIIAIFGLPAGTAGPP